MSVGETAKEINTLIELGRSWGMSDFEISECLIISANGEGRSTDDDHDGNGGKKKKKPAPSQQPSSLSGLMWWLLFFVKIVVVLPIAICVLAASLYGFIIMLATISPEFENSFGKISSPYVYPTMRAMRILFKPIAGSLMKNIEGYYSADCLVNNPFYVEPVDDCGPCEQKTEFADMSDKSFKRMSRLVEELTPFVSRGFHKSKVDFGTLQQMYFENESRFTLGGTVDFFTTLTDAYNISDVFYKYNHEDLVNFKHGTGFMAWDTNSVPSSQAIRKVFPRPGFIVESAEVSLLKRILIEGPLASTHELPIGGFASNWYVQAAGSRLLALVPHEECADDCDIIEILVKPGDLVYYQDQFWRLVSSPVTTDDKGIVLEGELGIAFAGSFTL